MVRNSQLMRVSPKFRDYLDNYKRELEGDTIRSRRVGIPYTKIMDFIVEDHKQIKKSRKWGFKMMK